MTLLFTDVERSTLLVERHGAAGTEALIRHHAIVREITEAHGGRLFERIGDAAYSVFPSPSDAVGAAIAIHSRLANEDWGPIASVRVRTALDTGELEESEGRFFGRILYRCARIQSLAGGGETLLSDTTAAAVADALPGGHRLRDLGEQKLRGLEGTARVWGVVPAPVHADRPTGATIRLLLVDDYEVVRRGLRGFLELMPQIEIVGEAANGIEAVDLAYRLQPDVILMDLVMPEMDGPTAIAAIHERQPEIVIIALTSFAEPERIAGAEAAGAVGHLMKDAEAEEVAAAIEKAYAERSAST
ncbi:MAG TPA: response regulator [Candidatus Limnocylindria bacterium]|jgi:CheY-like chemotaxis protein/class 3 adenylate cyclase